MNRHLLCLALACTTLFACAAQREEPEPTAAATTIAAPSQAVLFIRAARDAHALATRARTPDEATMAITTLRALAEQPTSPLSTTDAASLRRDLYAHAAQLALDFDRAADALALVSAGLALEGHDPYRVQLHLIAARIHEKTGDTQSEATALTNARTELDLGNATPSP